MRTTAAVDAALIAEVLRVTGLKTKREAAELGLRTLLRLGRQGEMCNLCGQLPWQSDLDSQQSDA